MMDDSNLQPLPELPPDLAELDRELAGLEMAERPSFAPELQAELEAEWARRAPGAGRGWMRHVAAAAAVVVAILGLSVPPARASLVDGLQRVLGVWQEPDVAAVVNEPARDDLSPKVAPESQPDPAVVSPEPVTPALLESGRVRTVETPDFSRRMPGVMTYPTLRDPDAEGEIALAHYPRTLQLAGVGGTVELALWVDSTGAVDHVQLSTSSGTPELDRAALRAARELRFNPLTRNGRADGTWVQFPLTFEPPEHIAVRAAPARTVEPTAPEFDAELSRVDELEVTASIAVEAGELLSEALRGAVDRRTFGSLGSMEDLLLGEPPEHANPLRWRAEAVEALQRAIGSDPDNPAPYLALARLRRKQGLRNDARLLLEVGLERAGTGTRPVSDHLVAELAWEHGRVTREAWLGWRGLGTVPASALHADPAECAPVAGSGVGSVAAEELVAWNYSCPSALQHAFEAGFEAREEGAVEATAMLASFERAVEAWPAHLDANREILLALADEEAWQALLNGARRFARASDGHPWARLMSGLALHRMGRSEEAALAFGRAWATLGPDASRPFRSPEWLGDDTGSSQMFWPALDPILATEVNEREVEHWARTAYASLRFGSLEADAARVWVRYGRPAEIRAFGAGAGMRTEFWDYGSGPDVTFLRPGWTANGALTPEAEAYLDDLHTVLPHRYGDRARSSYQLPARVTRFRGRMAGATELEIHAEVPAEMVSSMEDSITVGFFFLGADGIPIEQMHRTIPGTRRSVHALLPAGARTRRVAVELWNPALGVAAGLRVPAHLETEASAAALSELMLTDPLPVGGQPEWDDRSSLSPRTDDRIDGDRVGVYLELYELNLPSEVYRLDFELVGPTGRTVALRSRPSGQESWGRGWARRPVSDARSPEFATLDLTGVAPGIYTLRATISLPDERTVVRELPGLVREIDPRIAAPDERAAGFEGGVQPIFD